MTMEVSFAGLITDEFSLNCVKIFRSLFLQQHLLFTGPITLDKQQAGPITVTAASLVDCRLTASK